MEVEKRSAVRAARDVSLGNGVLQTDCCAWFKVSFAICHDVYRVEVANTIAGDVADGDLNTSVEFLHAAEHRGVELGKLVFCQLASWFTSLRSGKYTVRMSAPSIKFFWEPAKRHNMLRMKATKAHTVGAIPQRGCILCTEPKRTSLPSSKTPNPKVMA